MSLRTRRERLIQSLAYEGGSFFVMIPFYLLVAGGSTKGAAILMVCMTLAEAAWAPIFNSAFDRVDLRLSGRVASDRRQFWRVVHAVAHETSTVIVTVPILVFVGGLGWVEALFMDVGLTVVCIVYAYFFHLAYDALRPVEVAVTKAPFRIAA
jgi:uncharacterized membrane protein